MAKHHHYQKPVSAPTPVVVPPPAPAPVVELTPAPEPIVEVAAEPVAPKMVKILSQRIGDIIIAGGEKGIAIKYNQIAEVEASVAEMLKTMHPKEIRIL